MTAMEEPARGLGIYFQPAGWQHKYIRHADSSHIFERPERLRAVMVGIAAAVARCEAGVSPTESATHPRQTGLETPPISSAQDDLSSLLDGLSLQTPARSTKGVATEPTTILNVVPPPALPAVAGNILLHNAAVNLSHNSPPEAPFQPLVSPSASHPDVEQSSYLRNLVKWAQDAPERIKATGCEIPEGLDLNPGDLYLGPGSIVAIEGAVQSVCQAVTDVCKAPPDVVGEGPTAGPSTVPQHKRAFCAIRPPGHHCGEDEPSGFCYINNVVVGAMHAYLTEDVDRAIILDFDLHHGNGTQALVMPLNAASHADDLQLAAGKPPTRDQQRRIRRSWKGFYGSVHDIWSYPCEDGDLDLIKDASVSLASHGQYIENVHLQPYDTEEDFYTRNYPKYLALLDSASRFLNETDARPEKTLVFVSAGFDACEHEHQGMQRHDRRVPVSSHRLPPDSPDELLASFFARYTKDIKSFADKYAGGKIVSVLEGGYSDRALSSGAMGHICGLLGSEWSDNWWSEQELVKLEKATKRKRNGKLAPLPAELVSDTYLQRTHSLISSWEDTGGSSTTASAVASPAGASSGRMTLRERQKAPAGQYAEYELGSPIKRPTKVSLSRERQHGVKLKEEIKSTATYATVSRDYRVNSTATTDVPSDSKQAVIKHDAEEDKVVVATAAVQHMSLAHDDPTLVHLADAGPSSSAGNLADQAPPPAIPQAPPRIVLKFSRPPLSDS